MLALWAALSMVAQDVLLTLMVVAENRGRWVLAGLLDTVGWLAQIATIGISVDSIVKNGLTKETWIIIIAVSIANFVGTGLGTLLGKHIKELPPEEPNAHKRRKSHRLHLHIGRSFWAGLATKRKIRRTNSGAS